LVFIPGPFFALVFSSRSAWLDASLGASLSP
jgi:hypothetical protein